MVGCSRPSGGWAALLQSQGMLQGVDLLYTGEPVYGCCLLGWATESHKDVNQVNQYTAQQTFDTLQWLEVIYIIGDHQQITGDHVTPVYT